MTTWFHKTVQTTESLTSRLEGFYQLVKHPSSHKPKGPLQIQGIYQQIEIITDTYGVPHIYAQNENDLYFAQGYIHAQERLWQMEFNRRLGAGRLSEILGSATLDIDRLIRRIGMRRIAMAEVEALTTQSKKMLEAYALGVNTYIEQHTDHLPPEFHLLHLKPEAWQPVDSLQWGKLQSWSLSGNWESEIIRARMIAEVGPERAARLEAGYDPDHPLIIPGGTSYQGINPGMLEQYEQIKQLSGFSQFGGSNNWVVDGTRTESGYPILCNDPHLGQTVPSIWFECHLNAVDIDVTGASFPGSPGIIIGHNQHIAWGVTNAISDVQDLYIEKFSPENPLLYEFQGKWETARLIREEIHVKGEAQPTIEEIRLTRHGPIINELLHKRTNKLQLPEKNEEPLALRWNAFEAGTIIQAIHGLNQARNWEDFQAALRFWDTPPQNFVYADTEGNIGYIMAGRIPIRAQGQGMLPVPGWTGEYEWTGFIPFDELPHSYNPDEHIIVTANNRVVDDTYPYYISHEWLNGYRAQRIHDLLNNHEKLTLDTMAEIQMDQYSIPATEIVPYILQQEATTPMKRASQDILRAWNGILEPQSIAASITVTFLRILESIAITTIIGNNEELLHHYLGDGLYPLAPLNGYASRSRPLLLRLLKAQDDSWFANSAIPNGPKNWKQALERAFEATLEELQERLGRNILHWQYGIIHRMSYRHILGSVKAVEPFLNRGPFPCGGDADTVNMGKAAPGEPETVLTVPSYRQIIDLGNLENSRSIHAPGQSGIAGSKHYDDFISLWQTGKYHPMYYTRADIEQAAEEEIQMNPKKI